MEESVRNLGLGLLLATAAGLSTTIGSLLALLVRDPGPRLMSFTLGFSAGVMVLVSFVELLPHGVGEIGFMSAHAAFLLGMGVFLLLDMAIPHDYVLHEDHSGVHGRQGLSRAGVLVALGIGIHNFPEGMATLASSLNDVRVGAAVAAAVAIHNVPEGIAVAAPVYAATGSRRKAFLWSFLSGVAEPVGAGLAALLLLPFLTPQVMGWVMSGVAGIMVAISLDEIVPTAKEMESHHVPLLGVAAGIFVMALSLWLLGPHSHG